MMSQVIYYPMKPLNPDILVAAKRFADPDVCEQLVLRLRYDNGQPVCPHCCSQRIYCSNDRSVMRCRDCRKQFTLKYNTLMEDSPLDVGRWLLCLYAVDHQPALTCQQLKHLLGVTLKTAWLMRRKCHAVLSFTNDTQSFNEKLQTALKISKTTVERHIKTSFLY